MSSDSLERVADALGVASEYTHAAGHRVAVAPDTRARLVEALGFPATGGEQLEAALRDFENADRLRGLPPVFVVHGNDTRGLPVSARRSEAENGEAVACWEPEAGEPITWTFRFADLPFVDERVIDGAGFETRLLALPGHLPLGYHRLSVSWTGQGRRVATEIVSAPGQCWQPPVLADGNRVWGPSIQLYGLRSRRNWGVGDFTDLRDLAGIAGRLGAGFIGVNPLHALFSERPDRCSPYSPNSRLFLNSLYIDPDGLFAKGAPHLSETPMTAGGHVDYGTVTTRKQARFATLFGRLERGGSSEAEVLRRSFEEYVALADAGTRNFAVFETLREVHAFSGPGGAWSPWWRWPEQWGRPDSPAVLEFAVRHADRVRFHLFLQWLAERQLREASEAARDFLPLGLYGDMAVGFDRDGADAWMYRDVAPRGVSVGCPPDLRNPLGQDWGVAPFSPIALRNAAYRPFVDLLRANMRHCGVVRIDHAFQLLRLFWVPLGQGPRGGGYVRYPMEDLLAIIALESHRNRCAVVAEDLGTIPRGFRERIIEWDTLSYRVLHRERNEDRSYRAPSEYPATSTVAVGTHDQATLTGFWLGRDIEQRDRLKLYPSEEAASAAAKARPSDKAHLVEALRGYADLSGESENADGTPSADLIEAVHRFLARTPSRMMIVQPDDLTGEIEQVNMPATVGQHPNWKRTYGVLLEDFADHPLIRRVADMLRREGRVAGSREDGRDRDVAE